MLLSFLFYLILFTAANADIQPLQLIGTYTKLPIPPFSPTCSDGIRVLQVDPLTTNEGVFFVISHNQIQLTVQGGGFQTCESIPVDNPRFANRSATVLIRDSQIDLDQSNPLVRAFYLADETFFLGRELGPRTCGQAILPGNSVSMWMAPDTVINVPTGDYAINFKPGSKYIYYFSETDPCLYRGNAKQQGSLRPVPTPPSPTPSPAQLLSPVPNPSPSPFPSPSPAGNNVVPPPDDGVTITDGIVQTPGPGPACFPYDAAVQTKRGVLPLGELKVGDDVLVEKGRYSQVFAFTHATRAVWTDFVTLSTSKRTLTLSHGHYIYANGRAIQAEEVRVGDHVLDIDDGEVIVTKVGMTKKRGLYNAQTMDGNIVVDGLIVTTYTTALGKMMTAHALLTPIRVLRCLFSVDGLIQRIRRLWLIAYRNCKV